MKRAPWCDFALAGVVSWKIGLPGVRLEVGNDRVGKDTVPFRQSGLESKGYCKRSTLMTKKKDISQLASYVLRPCSCRPSSVNSVSQEKQRKPMNNTMTVGRLVTL